MNFTSTPIAERTNTAERKENRIHWKVIERSWLIKMGPLLQRYFKPLPEKSLLLFSLAGSARIRWSAVVRKWRRTHTSRHMCVSVRQQKQLYILWFNSSRVDLLENMVRKSGKFFGSHLQPLSGSLWLHALLFSLLSAYKSGLFASRTLKWWQKSRDKWPASNMENFIYFERWASVDIRQYVPSRTTIVWMQSVYVGLYVVCVWREGVEFLNGNQPNWKKLQQTNKQ